MPKLEVSEKFSEKKRVDQNISHFFGKISVLVLRFAPKYTKNLYQYTSWGARSYRRSWKKLRKVSRFRRKKTKR